MTSETVLEELSAIATAECAEGVRVGDKLKALDLMGKHHRIFNESVGVASEQTDRQELVIILQSALETIDVTPEPPLSHSG